MVVKENTTESDAFWIDLADSSFVRSEPYFRAVFAEAGFSVLVRAQRRDAAAARRPLTLCVRACVRACGCVSSARALVRLRSGARGSACGRRISFRCGCAASWRSECPAGRDWRRIGSFRFNGRGECRWRHPTVVPLLRLWRLRCVVEAAGHSPQCRNGADTTARGLSST